MKPRSYIFLLPFILSFASCSNNDGPDHLVFMQPSAITSTDANGSCQKFEYDDLGRIISWSYTPNTQAGFAHHSAHFDYADDNIIKVVSVVDFLDGNKRYYNETINLVNGRASDSEGTFIYELDENTVLRKTYRLSFDYDQTDHLAVVRHAEVVGTGDDVKPGAWDKSWTWEDFLIWEDGNLKEFQDYNGHTSVFQTTKYDYTSYVVDCPVIIPAVVNSSHHIPLMMQGVFGSNSVNLLKSAVITDEDGNFTLSRQYTYGFENARIIEYQEMTTRNTAISTPVSYKVNWTAR